MKSKLTKAQALKRFNEDVLPPLKEKFPNDIVAYKTAWNDYTDQLNKSGLISDRQVDTWTQPNFN